ncbi:MAG: lysophospholipase, partial [Gemmataceae bacterium]|nr:lysophospholipase [Gemmataceae bacterium]
MAESTENPRLVRIPLPGGRGLVGDFDPAATDFAVVWVHGFGSHRGGEKAAAVRAECGRRGWAFAAFDFGGHGETGGPMHELRASRLLEELAAIRSFLAGRGHTRLGLVGSSMGGFASAWFARRHPGAVAGLVLLAPAFRFFDRRVENLTAEHLAEWRRTDRLRVTNDWVDAEIGYGLVAERDAFPLADLLGGWGTPTLIYHGMNDEVVPDADTTAAVRALAYPRVELRLLRDGDHRLTAHKDE